jgi:hypothetical protein
MERFAPVIRMPPMVKRLEAPLFVDCSLHRFSPRHAVVHCVRIVGCMRVRLGFRASALMFYVLSAEKNNVRIFVVFS